MGRKAIGQIALTAKEKRLRYREKLKKGPVRWGKMLEKLKACRR